MQPLNSSGQHYVVADETIWSHARPGLDDLRIYDAEKELPYKLETEFGGSETEQKPLRVLQPAFIDGKTQFFLDMSGAEEYDRVELQLSSKNFVAHARIEGQDDLHGAHWALLGTSTLYDLSDEKLGNNSTLQIPLSAFRFLRVTVDGIVKPSAIQRATAGVNRTQKAMWREVSGTIKQEQLGKDTILSFSVPVNTPIERLVLGIDPLQANFRREVEVKADPGVPYGVREISRIHMVRNGKKIDVEQNAIDLAGGPQGTLKAVIHNGDDAPIEITGAHLEQFERRIYFQSDSGTRPWIYYGDEKLSSPVYDYAKLFQHDPRVDAVGLQTEQLNSAYTGRPDDRPWSERHPAVLWVTILAAVAILGAIATRSLKAAAPSP